MERATEPASLLRDLQRLARHPRRAGVPRNRLDAHRGNTDMCHWAKVRRERTRPAVERGGLVRKAGVVEVEPLRDDPMALLGSVLPIAGRLRAAEDARDASRSIAAHWRRRGVRAFDADHEPLSPQPQVRRQEGI